jgi:transglutaminase-like putative cysteine protease
MSDQFLAESDVVDWRHPKVLELAETLASADQIDFVRQAFEWVRDEIRHSGDFEVDRVTCAASEVLAHRTGFCYAKSHLLVALCRARGIRAGFGYQRLSINGDGPPFCLHGFAVIDLGKHGWRRLDPRGNKPGITTKFDAANDSLAFRPTLAGETTFMETCAEPMSCVVSALRQFPGRLDFVRHLPDAPAPPSSR